MLSDAWFGTGVILTGFFFTTAFTAYGVNG